MGHDDLPCLCPHASPHCECFIVQHSDWVSLLHSQHTLRSLHTNPIPIVSSPNRLRRLAHYPHHSFHCEPQDSFPTEGCPRRHPLWWCPRHRCKHLPRYSDQQHQIFQPILLRSMEFHRDQHWDYLCISTNDVAAFKEDRSSSDGSVDLWKDGRATWIWHHHATVADSSKERSFGAG